MGLSFKLIFSSNKVGVYSGVLAFILGCVLVYLRTQGLS